jgi:hypothetical protein
VVGIVGTALAQIRGKLPHVNILSGSLMLVPGAIGVRVNTPKFIYCFYLFVYIINSFLGNCFIAFIILPLLMHERSEWQPQCLSRWDWCPWICKSGFLKFTLQYK